MQIQIFQVSLQLPPAIKCLFNPPSHKVIFKILSDRAKSVDQPKQSTVVSCVQLWISLVKSVEMSGEVTLAQTNPYSN